MTSWLTTIQSAMSDLMSGKSSYRRAVRGTLSLHPEASLCFDKGLSNAPGANNCFLNAAIQVLWHIDVFRRSFRSFETHVCVGSSCIFCALKVLLTQFQHSELPTLPPDVLRQAMAVCYESKQRFKIGQMDDAAECLEKMLEQIHFHLTGNEDLETCTKECCISHRKFELSIVEITICNECGATSEPLSFIQFIHYISSSALLDESIGQNRLSFGSLIKGASYERRECSNVQCKKPLPLKKILLNCPDVVCIGMIWDSDQSSVDYITKVVNNIGTTMRTTEAFDSYNPSSSKVEYQLKAIVAYYGRHYAAYCFHSHIMHWVYFDDALVKDLGPDWASAVKHCLKAHYQPLLLIYINPDGQPISGAVHPAAGGTQETPNVGTTPGPSAASNSGPNTGPNTGPSAASNSGPNTGPNTGSSTAPSSGSNASPNTGFSTALSSGSNTGPNTGSSTAPSSGSNAGPNTGSSTAPSSGSNTGPNTGSRTAQNSSSSTTSSGSGTSPNYTTGPSSEPSQGMKPSAPERGNSSGGGDGANNVGGSTFTGRGSTTKEGGNPSNGTITEEDIGANASPSVPNSIGQPGFKPAVQQGTVHLPEQQQGVTTGRWSPSMQRKRPGSHPAVPTPLPWQSTLPPSSSTGQHGLPLPSPWQQKDPALARETRMEQGAGPSQVEGKDCDLSENLMEFSITPEQLHRTARTAGSETGRGGVKTGRGESEQDEGRQSDHTLADRDPHPQSEDLIMFSVVPRPTAAATAPLRSEPQATRLHSTQNAPQYQNGHPGPVDMRHTPFAMVTGVLPNMGYTNRTGSSPNLYSSHGQQMYAQTGQSWGVQPAPIAAQQQVSAQLSAPYTQLSTPLQGSTPYTQLSTPAQLSTPTQLTAPYVTPYGQSVSQSFQPSVPGSALGYQNAQTQRAPSSPFFSGTHTPGSTGGSSNGSRPVGPNAQPAVAGPPSSHLAQSYPPIPIGAHPSPQYGFVDRPMSQQCAPSNPLPAGQPYPPSNGPPSQQYAPSHRPVPGNARAPMQQYAPSNRPHPPSDYAAASRQPSQTLTQPPMSENRPSLLANLTAIPHGTTATPSPTPPPPPISAPPPSHALYGAPGVQNAPTSDSGGNNILQSISQGVGSTFMKIFGFGSEDTGTRPDGGQRRVPSSGQIAGHPAPDRQIDLALIEALPEGTKVAVYDALNTRAQAEAMLGCDDVTARIFYKRAADLLHGLECSPSLYNNDKLRMQIADCKLNILDWLNVGAQANCTVCGQKRELNSRMVCGPCCLKEKKASGSTYV